MLVWCQAARHRGRSSSGPRLFIRCGSLDNEYTPGFVGNALSPLPKLTWKSSTLLTVTVPGVIEDIKVQKMEVGRTKLAYKLGHRLSLLDLL